MNPKVVGWRAEDEPLVIELATALRHSRPDCGTAHDPIIHPGVVIFRSAAPPPEETVGWLTDIGLAAASRQAATREPVNKIVHYVPEDDVTGEEQHTAASIRAARLTGGYVEHFIALGITSEEVKGFTEQERRLLATMYFAARESPPSADKLLRLALQLAIDVRQPVTGNLQHVTLANLTVTNPSAEPVWAWVRADPPDALRLAAWIERTFGRQPERREINPANARVIEYTMGTPTRLWVGDVEVASITGKNEQALLRYFCENVEARMTGPELVRELGEDALTNPSYAAQVIRAALGHAHPPAQNWFLTRPFRWADDVIVRPRGS